jgi:hemerythrin
MAWSNDLSVGVRVLDEDHKKLVAMVNELYDAMKDGKGKETLGGILGRLTAYTVEHFDREERLFSQTSYPNAAAHRGEHEALKAQVSDIQRKYNAGSGISLTLETMNFLKSWLLNHIKGSDQKYSQHLNAHGFA